MAATSAATSPGGMSRPVSPSITASETLPTLVAITGVEASKASTIVSGNGLFGNERGVAG